MRQLALRGGAERSWDENLDVIMDRLGIPPDAQEKIHAGTWTEADFARPAPQQSASGASAATGKAAVAVDKLKASFRIKGAIVRGADGLRSRRCARCCRRRRRGC